MSAHSLHWFPTGTVPYTVLILIHATNINTNKYSSFQKVSTGLFHTFHEFPVLLRPIVFSTDRFLPLCLGLFNSWHGGTDMTCISVNEFTLRMWVCIPHERPTKNFQKKKTGGQHTTWGILYFGLFLRKYTCVISSRSYYSNSHLTFCISIPNSRAMKWKSDQLLLMRHSYSARSFIVFKREVQGPVSI